MLTTARVRELKPRDNVYEVTCTAIRGFVVRVLPTGKKVFLVRHCVDGRWRRERIGQMSATLTVDGARERAALILAGHAPNEASDQPVARRTAPRSRRLDEPVKSSEPPRMTVRELAQRFHRDFIDVYLKPSTAFNYRRHLDNDILPVLGDRDFESVTRKDAQALHVSLRRTPGTANYVLCVLGSLYKRIIVDWELSDMRNPAYGIRRFKMRKLERFLSPEERQRVQETLARGLAIPPGRKGHLDRMSVWALQLLALTGMRRDEVRELTWPMVDWQHACLHLHDTKTGPRSVPVSSQVLELLRSIHQETGNRSHGRVVCSRTGETLSSLNRTWTTIRERVGIPDVRLHDLRHSFASDALMGGVPLAIVGEMLGHRQASTTQRYAHLANRVVREALEHTATRIVEASKSRTVPSPPEFTPLRAKQWEKLAPLVTPDQPRTGKQVDLRRVIDGIRWVLHTDGRWVDIPNEYAAATTCWRWYSRWCENGRWLEIETTIAEAVTATPARQPKPRPRPGG